MIAQVYDALRSAGADDDKGAGSGEPRSPSDRDIADLRLEMSGVRTAIADMRLLRWMVGSTIALVLGPHQRRATGR